MDPRLTNISEKDGILRFRLEGVNVSLANAIRRTLLADIDTIVFHTFPYNENKADILVNTTRFNNEILKQRLSCIPIHIEDLTIPLDQYVVEISKKNETDTIQYVTTEDFKVKNIKTNTYLNEKENKKIFPPNHTTKQFIDFARLSPKISDIDGSELQIVAKMSISNAKTNSMYNVVSTCSYKNTQDKVLANEKLDEFEEELRGKGLKQDEIKFEKENWKLLEAKRFVVENSYDFIVESIGVFPNKILLQKACDSIITRLNNIISEDEDQYISYDKSLSTIPNSYDITLKGEDYTIGKIIEYYLYTQGYMKDGVMTYVGFTKEHPHDDHSIIRIGFKSETDVDTAKGFINMAVLKLVQVYKEIRKAFEGEIIQAP